MKHVVGLVKGDYDDDYDRLKIKTLPQQLSDKIFMLRPSITNIQTSQRVPLTQNYFPSVYVKIFVTFATKVPYLTFCDKM